MSMQDDETLRALLRRVEDAHGAVERTRPSTAVAPDDPAELWRAVADLVEDHERLHRRLIETNVQLVSLREVASRMVSSLHAEGTTRTVTRYLRHAFGYGHAFLLLFDRERGTLSGTWTHGGPDGERSHAIELSLAGDGGVLTRSFWLDRAIHVRDPRRHPVACLLAGHTLEEALARLGSTACVPLQRSVSVPATRSLEPCGAECVVGNAAVLVPPASQSEAAWTRDREVQQRRCMSCERMSMLGVIGVARDADDPPLTAADVAQVESVALSVAPMVENAELYRELRHSERFRLHLLDSMTSALVAVNMEGDILTFNRSAQEMLGVSEADARGQPFGALFGEEGEALVRATMTHGRECLRRETTLRTRAGAAVPVSLTTSLLRNEGREVYGAIATFTDLTPLRRAEEHARRQDRLAALGRFTSSVAHEIRNPLTGIAAGVQYLARSLDGSTQRENLDFILSEIKRLDHIVQDLFDVTHPRDLLVHPAPLDEAVRRAGQSLAAVLGERGVTLHIEVDPSTPPVPHDADQMQQVFINLVKNAAEASAPGGRIQVALAVVAAGEREGTQGAGATVVARVQDQGTGIRAEHLKTVFEPFFTTRKGGSGLGLYISNDIVKRHGGSLTVHSEPGLGTTFSVEMPIDAAGGTP